VSLWLLLLAAALLGVERACYVWIVWAPRSFRRWCARPGIARWGEPVAVVRALFWAFKGLQVLVFLGWCYAHGDGPLAPAGHRVVPLAIGGLLAIVGQVLNALVFYRLGWTAVFFGDRLGYAVTRCQAFPFSVLRHPQYVGAVLTIWGVFVAGRFPYDDWYVLPLLETVYYAVGAYLEDAETGVVSPRPARAARPLPEPSSLVSHGSDAASRCHAWRTPG
jgi:phosphatidyl-N-methylethanolamine N-methyltransferase